MLHSIYLVRSGIGLVCCTHFGDIAHISDRKVVTENCHRKLRVKVRGLTCFRGWYYFRPRQAKGVVAPRQALGTMDFDEAVRLGLELQREAAVMFRAGALQFEIDRYIKQRHYRSRWTQDADRSALRVFARYIGDQTQAGQVTSDTIEAWKSYLLRDGKNGLPMSAGTVATYLARVSSFFEWLKKDQLMIARNPVRTVRAPRVRNTRVERFCTKPERDLLLRLALTVSSRAHSMWTERRSISAESSSVRERRSTPGFGTKRTQVNRESIGPRMDLAAVLMLGFHAGLRLNEIVQARVNWLRFWMLEGEWHGEIVVQETPTFCPKDREARAIPMNRVLLDFLRPLSRDNMGDSFLIRPEVKQGKDKYRWNPRAPLKRVLAQAKLAWVGVHTFRHTYATHLVMGGVPIKTVALWLGDDEIPTARTYAGYLLNRSHVDAGL